MSVSQNLDRTIFNHEEDVGWGRPGQQFEIAN